MATKLSESGAKEWYKRLNFVRTTEISAEEIPYPTGGTPTEIVHTLAEGVIATASTDTPMSVVDSSAIVPEHIVPGKPIREIDHAAIDQTIMQLLRTCNNETCATVCTQSMQDSNGMMANGRDTNDTCSNQACANGTAHTFNSNGSCGYGGALDGYYHSQSGYHNECYHATYSNGNHSNGGECWNGTNTNGNHANGVNTNTTCSNQPNSNGGDSNAVYDPATATYANKDFYTEEEAIDRLP